MEFPQNEPILAYLSGSPERTALELALNRALEEKVAFHSILNGKFVPGSKLHHFIQPHDHQHTLGTFSEVGVKECDMAIEGALRVFTEWSSQSLAYRAGIFFKAADLVAGPYRARINAATMLGQSKNVYQAEIDSACELADFLRFNVAYAQQIEQVQPYSPEGMQNRLEYRSLEGFVVAITPFNFTAIAGNLPAAPALCGNVVVWKPAFTQLYAARVIMEIFMEAGLPDGVIQLVIADGPALGERVFKHPEFAGLHFTGSTTVFNQLWQTIGSNIGGYKQYPRIVGETGGKDFVLALPDASVKALATALVRGAFEYQGQKCSAASRAYIPQSIWPDVWKELQEQLALVTMGHVNEFSNLMNAVIDERSYDRIMAYIQQAHLDEEVTIVYGGKGDKAKGFFIEPTIILSQDPHYVTMKEELFGPVLTIYLYAEKELPSLAELINSTSAYALTGAVFSEDPKQLEVWSNALRFAAGNFYLNDKPTGAVVHQQPFGGARKSGTNDKAGSMWNVIRWMSPRTIKQTQVPPTNPLYPYMHS